jgi:hypothetical protein
MVKRTVKDLVFLPGTNLSINPDDLENRQLEERPNVSGVAGEDIGALSKFFRRFR